MNEIPYIVDTTLQLGIIIIMVLFYLFIYN